MILKRTNLFFIYTFLHLIFNLQISSLQAEVKLMVPKVLSKIPHDHSAFTQGLGFIENKLYESTGLYNQSTLRVLDISTGRIDQKQFLSHNFFAEGLAVFPEKIIQITWKQKKALIYHRKSLEQIEVLDYEGEGWGLCRDGNTVWMSDGTSRLTQREAKSFKVLKQIFVKLNEVPVNLLNDLECVGDSIYANIWMSNKIIRIEKATGQVDVLIEVPDLLSTEERKRLGPEDVLNGIAFNPFNKSFFITGKRWPHIFEVRFIPAPNPT